MSRLGQIKQTFKSVRIEIKAFLRRQQWKEALIFFCFILLAFGFWLLQSLQQEYEIDIRIPVKYKNVPPDISFTETPPEAITVKVKDKGSVLLNYSFGRSFAPIEANMKTQSEKSGKLIINRKDIENEIKKHLIATTSLLSFEPQHIDAVYSKRIKKEIPAVFEGVVQTNAGFKVSGDISITPRSINVYASDVVLDTLKEIKTIYTEIGGGIGVPPLFGAARQCGKNATVAVGFRNKDFVILEDDFRAAGCDLRIATDDGSYGHHGLVIDLIQDVHPDKIFACGPKVMLRAVTEFAKAHNIPCEISLEERMACGIGACLGCAVELYDENGETYMGHVCKDGPVFPAERVVF